MSMRTIVRGICALGLLPAALIVVLHGQQPQPPAQEGEKLPERGCDEQEAFTAWLRHVEARRIG